MSVAVLHNHPSNLQGATVARKRTNAVPVQPEMDADKGSVMKQIAFRAPVDLVERVDKVSKQLGLDTSNFMRMLLVEQLSEYERRARKIREGEQP